MKPPCPVCVAEVDEVWLYRFHGAGLAADDVLTLYPCDHELRAEAMVRYREALVASQQS